MENWEIPKIATLEILAFSDINNMPRSQNFPGVLPLSPNQESALDLPPSNVFRASDTKKPSAIRLSSIVR